MPQAKVLFHRLVQDSQDYGSDDEHMVSRVFFDLEIDEAKYTDLHADVKQTVGSDFETGPLEVSRPSSYRGPFSHEAFQQAVERYYRGLVGATGRGVRITGGSNIRMRNNTFIQPGEAEFDVAAAGTSW